MRASVSSVTKQSEPNTSIIERPFAQLIGSVLADFVDQRFGSSTVNPLRGDSRTRGMATVAHLGHGTVTSVPHPICKKKRPFPSVSSKKRLQPASVADEGSTIVYLEHAAIKHTIVWTHERESRTPGQRSLPAGRCCLYTYPNFTPTTSNDEGSHDLMEPDAGQIELLDELVLELQGTRPGCMFDRDESGAQVAHALCVANTEASLTLVLRLYSLEPALIAQPHVDVPGSPSAVFKGENCLHCLAVNWQHAAIMKVLRLAAKHLPADGLKLLLNSQAEGSFFLSRPMCFYGGHPIAYLAAFKATAALTLIFSSPPLLHALELHTRPDGHQRLAEAPTREAHTMHAFSRRATPPPMSPMCTCTQCTDWYVRWHCVCYEFIQDPISGYGPLHAVVACGHEDVYDFLRQLPKTLPPEAKALASSIFHPQQKSKATDGFRTTLTPLQLACKLGDQLMVIHLLQHKAQVEWRWGPVTKFRVELSEIDSCASAHGADVMELIVAHDAHEQTKRLLSDEFMDGMIFQLFESKWRSFAARLHYLALGLEVGTLACLLVLGFGLKEHPSSCDRRATPALLLGATVALAGIECLGMRRWWAQQQREGRQGLLPWMREFIVWARANGKSATYVRLVLLSIVAVVTLQGARSIHLADGAGDEALWFLAGVASLTQFTSVIATICLPMRQMGVFAISVERVLLTDVRMFLTFLLLQALNLFAALYLVYPRAGTSELSLFPQFNSAAHALYAMLYFAIDRKRLIDGVTNKYSPRAEVQPTGQPTALEELHEWYHFVGIVLFGAIYAYAIVLLVILLVRLLMAMLTATFNRVRSESVLEWRMQLARRVLFAELVVGSLFGDAHLHAGVQDQKSNGFYHSFLGCADGNGVDVWMRMRTQLGGQAIASSIPPASATADDDDQGSGEGGGGDGIGSSDGGGNSARSTGGGTDAAGLKTQLVHLRALLMAGSGMPQRGGGGANCVTGGFFQSLHDQASPRAQRASGTSSAAGNGRYASGTAGSAPNLRGIIARQRAASRFQASQVRPAPEHD